ncbi:hypothetical protein LEA_16205, partial [human gut metagenome]
FNNHIMAVSSTNPSAYMDASNRRVNFSASTALYKIITREQLLAAEDNAWGPAHEVGHINQGASTGRVPASRPTTSSRTT